MNVVFVRNINYKTEGEALATAFKHFGDISNARIISMWDPVRRARISRGFGFIEFRTADAYQTALDNMQPITVDGRELVVRAARPVRKRDTAFIRGIPHGTTDSDIKAVFAKYNPVEVRIKAEDSSDRKGFAFVTFDTEENQTAAVTENKTIFIRGAESVVRFSRPQQRLGAGFRRGGRTRGGAGWRPPVRASRVPTPTTQAERPPAPRGARRGFRRQPPRSGGPSPFTYRPGQDEA
jgi:multiple RNA-binding domain-containing protein 1